MTRPVSPIPDGHHAITPYMILDDCARALAWYREAFGAVEHLRIAAPGGKVGHAEMQIGDSMIMLADEFPEMGARSAKALNASPVSFLIYVKDVDAAAQRAIAAGAQVIRPVKDQFYGDRSGTFADPFGYQWHLATHIEDVGAEEMQRRSEALHAAP